MAGRTFVVGDIHGCLNTFETLMLSECKITRNDEIILLGDYIDRGPFIKETILFILNLIKSGYNIVPLRGNHEQLLIESLNNPKMLKQWFKNGAQSTLDSFWVMNPGLIDDEIIKFFENTRYYYISGDYICTHAGLNFEVHNPLKDTSSMLWIRNINIVPELIGGRKLIVGHTPTELDKIKTTINTNFIKLDGGCVYYKKVKGLGYLCALELNSLELFYLQNIDF
jgi:serine/threonine protein phosphatase 1